jgi:hypothetical protein
VLEEGFLGPFVALKWLNVEVKCTFTCALINPHSAIFELSDIGGTRADETASMCSHVHTFTLLYYPS